MTSQNVSYQMVPPGIHRRNAAERAIRTFKNHFIAGLSSTDSNFPIHLWDKLLDQAILSLNLLRGSRVSPTKSACEDLFGPFDYNAVRITDTVEWLPDRLPIPTPSTDDLIIAGKHDIKYALLHPSAQSCIIFPGSFCGQIVPVPETL